MLTEVLPKRIRYPQAGIESASFEGVLPISRLPRLAEALLDNGLDNTGVPESVVVKLRFSSGRSWQGFGSWCGTLRSAMAVSTLLRYGFTVW